ncbi:MAG: PRC-barrel domain-containing protein [Gemmatimonadales bacterium]
MASSLSNNHASYVLPARQLPRFQLGDDRVDIISWPVFAADGRLVGAVEKLIVQPVPQKVRYISVSLITHAAHDYRPNEVGSVLVPIGVVRRIDDRQAVTLDTISSSELAVAPRLRARAITRGDEETTLAAYGMPTSLESRAADFYKRSFFDDSTLIA